MKYGENEGPTLKNIPSHTYSSCNNCKYFESRGMVFGHDFRKDQTSCNHPAVINTQSTFYTNGKGGKIIEYMTESHENYTPDWCPFKKQKQ